MIGHKKYLGQGLASPTLQTFMQYYTTHEDAMVDTYLIDHVATNTRAWHIYDKAGFKNVDTFYHDFSQEEKFKHILMIKKIKQGNS